MEHKKVISEKYRVFLDILIRSMQLNNGDDA
jgi:hypothetical protein